MFMQKLIRYCKRKEKRFENEAYKVSLLYPSHWQQVDETRFAGKDGFFQVAAIASEGRLAEVCQNEAYHQLKPYGSTPIIRGIRIKGRDGCLIFPSADQPSEMNKQAALITKYPQSVYISGQSYNYFVLWADKAHIQRIAETVKFL